MTDDVAKALIPIDPPSQTRRTSTTKPKASAKGMTDTQLRATLVSSIDMLGTAISFVDDFDGELIASKAEKLADLMLELAKTNPKVRARLESLVAAGAWSGVVTLIGAEIALPIAVHHNLLPEGINSYLAESQEIEVRPRKGKLAVVKEINEEGNDNGS